MDTISLYQLSSLDKVYLDSTFPMDEFNEASVMNNEKFSYQIAYKCDKNIAIHNMEIEVVSPLKEFVTVRTVRNVPVETPVREVSDVYYEKYTPGLYPDVLCPLENNKIEMRWMAWHSMWITVSLDGSVKGGNYPIEIKMKDDEIEVSKTFNLKVIDASIPKQELIFTQWFHADCLADYYNVPVWSDEHWEKIESFMKTAVENGINMILTPIITPPLDTEVGGERTTVQLVDVYLNNGIYSFDCENLRKWITLCKKVGYNYFEMAHLFSQWGLEFAPKVMATVDGEERRIFGWDVKSDDERYLDFLSKFLPAVYEVLKEEKIEDRTFFHISDEPAAVHLERYKYLKDRIKDILPEIKIVDALSNYEYYKEGVVDFPISATDHIDIFIDNKVPELWCYYCCSQRVNVSNRFIAMPSYRNRVIGLQLYKFDISGFLHWGYNFYNSDRSKKKINPFMHTDAIGTYQSGDPFSVYPGEDGALESLRLLVFYDAIQDLGALKLLESFIGKEKVVALIEKEARMEIKFDKYPHDKNFLLRFREKINEEIEKHLA